MLTCLVDGKAKARLVVSEEFVLGDCLKYEFDLEKRQTIPASHETPFTNVSDYDKAAKVLFTNLVGTPEKLMTFVENTSLSKLELASLLNPGVRNLFLNICNTIEKRLTEACTAKNDPCLEGGCALEGQTCLNACLTADRVYYGQCADVWIELFRSPANRIDVWRN